MGRGSGYDHPKPVGPPPPSKPKNHNDEKETSTADGRNPVTAPPAATSPGSLSRAAGAEGGDRGCKGAAVENESSN
jgi:hypothetical protein